MIAPASPLSPRRGFLRGLASLPLIDGKISILGHPTAVAFPISESLLARYHAFVSRENVAVLAEIDETRWPTRPGRAWNWRDVETYRYGVPMIWLREDPSVERLMATARPSTRAALVLSAIGCLGQISAN